MAEEIKKGVYVAALTPLRPNLKIHEKALTKHCLNLLQRGCTGVVLFGTTGEGASFSVKEKIKTLKYVIKNGVDPKKLIIGNGSANLQDTSELCAAAVKLNCLTCLLAPPCFYKPVTDEGVIAFYQEVIKHLADHPPKILLYHIPQYTGVPITVNILKTLSNEFPGIVVGVKESEGNLALTEALLKAVPETLLFVGKESQLPEALKLGASGTICGIANLWPELVCSLYQTGSCPELQARVHLMGNLPFIAFCKALMSKEIYRHWNIVRPPLTTLSQEEIKQLKKGRECGFRL